MPYDDRFRLAEGIDEANNISAQLEKVVVLDGLWPVCLAVAALIRRDDVVSCLSQRPNWCRQEYHNSG